MTNSNTEHSRKLRSKSSAKVHKDKQLLGYRHVVLPPETIKLLDALKSRDGYNSRASVVVEAVKLMA